MSQPANLSIVRQPLIHAAIIVGAGLLLALPVILWGFPLVTDDGTCHANWCTHFSRQFWDGELYPRWLHGMNGGLGDPSLYWCPPLGNYVASLFRAVFQTDPHGLRQLGMASAVALILSGLFAYLWLVKDAGRPAALTAAILYMALPYHLAVDLYDRGAYAEFWAFAWMPLILYLVDGLDSPHRLSFPALVVAFALLFVTHLPTAVIFSIVPVVYGWVSAGRARKLKQVVQVTMAGLLGVGLSAVYWLPAMATREFTGTVGYAAKDPFFLYRNQFLFNEPKLWGNDLAKLSLMLLAIIGLAITAFLMVRTNPNGVQRRQGYFWFALFLVSVLMMTAVSDPVWRILPMLQAVEFPWRFNTIAMIATTALLALAVRSLKTTPSGLKCTSLVVAGLSLLSWLAATGWAVWTGYPQTSPFQAEVLRRTSVLQFSVNPSWLQKPKWAKPLSIENLQAILSASAQHPGVAGKAYFPEGTGTVRVQQWQSRRITLEVETAEPTRLNVCQYYFPYWTARLDGSPQVHPVQPSDPDGLVSLEVPAGRHQIVLRLERGPPEIWGDRISAVTALAVGLLVVVLWIVPRFRKDTI